MKRKTIMKLMLGNFAVGLPLAVGASILGGCHARTTMAEPAARPEIAPPSVIMPPPPRRVDNASPPAPAEGAAVVVKLVPDKMTYHRGDTLNLTISARNPTQAVLSLNFISGQSFDITATPQGGTDAVWRWSQGKLFTREMRQVPLRPGEEKSWTATWDQADAAGATLPRGHYVLDAQVRANGGLHASPVTIGLED